MPATRLKIFISSVQKEFAQQRRDLKAFLLGDAVLRRFVSEVFLFEELPARDHRADAIYLQEVEHCDIYLGIFGYQYGFIDENGISPTEHEFNHAGRKGKVRLIYVWGSEDKRRDPKMQQLIAKASNELVRRRIEVGSALTAEVYASLVDYLDLATWTILLKRASWRRLVPPAKGRIISSAVKGSRRAQRAHSSLNT
ncbi:MAG: hypothetical protein ACD_87C00035G0002 [uncultured bacterium]|nr:MAG: hypothetical protein ACD_87C00035G0002 [uncultured bacterium]